MHTAVLHNSHLVNTAIMDMDMDMEFHGYGIMDMETVTHKFSTMQSICTPNPQVVQGSTVLTPCLPQVEKLKAFWIYLLVSCFFVCFFFAIILMFTILFICFGASSLCFRASPLAQTVKNLPARQETWVWTLGQEDPLKKEMATHSSILAWRILWTEEPGRL